MELAFEIISSFLFIIVFSLISGLLSRLAAFTPDPTKYPPLEELQQRWGRFNIKASIALLPAGAAIIYTVWRALTFFSESRLPDKSNVIYIETTEPALLFLVAFFLGLFMTMPVMLGVLRLILQDRLDEFIYYDNLNSGTDWYKILRIGSFTVVPLLLFLSVMLCDSYIYYYRDRVLYNALLSHGETVYENRDIKAFEYYYYDGEENNSKVSYELTIKDGTTITGTFFAGSPVQKKFFSHIERISKEAGFTVERKKR